MRIRLIAALAVLALGSLPTGRSAASVTPDQIRFDQCEEVFAFVPVPEANVAQHLPAGIEPLVSNGRVDVQLRTARCQATIDSVTAHGLSSEVRITIEPPDGAHEALVHLIGYQLSWATDDQAYASWLKRGTDVGEVVQFSKALSRMSNPDAAGVDPSFSFDSPAPADWAFRFGAFATWPHDEITAPIVVDIYRRTSEGLVRFRADSRTGGDRIAGAEVDVTVPARTALASLLNDGTGCTVDAEATRCRAASLVYGYAVEIEDQPFTKTIVRPPADPAVALEEARQATLKYADVSQALADGYIPVSRCDENASKEAMGIHFYNDELATDLYLDHRRPELLLYLPRTNGGLQLVALEYLVDDIGPRGGDGSQPHPELFGQPFDGPMAGHNRLQGWHYDLHVWPFQWAPNRSGTFAKYNPDLHCPVQVDQ